MQESVESTTVRKPVLHWDALAEVKGRESLRVIQLADMNHKSRK